MHGSYKAAKRRERYLSAHYSSIDKHAKELVELTLEPSPLLTVLKEKR
jgi:hypothetical protein